MKKCVFARNPPLTMAFKMNFGLAATLMLAACVAPEPRVFKSDEGFSSCHSDGSCNRRGYSSGNDGNLLAPVLALILTPFIADQQSRQLDLDAARRVLQEDQRPR
jgi:hypothetical protein